MRGLIFKDLIFLKTTWKNLLVMFAGSFMISLAIGNYLLTIIVVPIVLAASGINTFQTDEFFNTEAYTLSYPLSRKEIVGAKYLFTLLMLALSSYLGLLIYALVHFTLHPGFNGINVNMLKYLFMLECVSILISAIFYPIIYKYGCEKARFVLMSILMVLLGIISLISVSSTVFNLFTIDIASIAEFIQSYGLYILVVLVVIFFTLSYFISLKIYSKKD